MSQGGQAARPEEDLPVPVQPVLETGWVAGVGATAALSAEVVLRRVVPYFQEEQTIQRLGVSPSLEENYSSPWPV